MVFVIRLRPCVCGTRAPLEGCTAVPRLGLFRTFCHFSTLFDRFCEAYIRPCCFVLRLYVRCCIYVFVRSGVLGFVLRPCFSTVRLASVFFHFELLLLCALTRAHGFCRFSFVFALRSIPLVVLKRGGAYVRSRYFDLFFHSGVLRCACASGLN